jgi:hypothetical protein
MRPTMIVVLNLSNSLSIETIYHINCFRKYFNRLSLSEITTDLYLQENFNEHDT